MPHLAFLGTIDIHLSVPPLVALVTRFYPKGLQAPITWEKVYKNSSHSITVHVVVKFHAPLTAYIWTDETSLVPRLTRIGCLDINVKT